MEKLQQQIQEPLKLLACSELEMMKQIKFIFSLLLVLQSVQLQNTYKTKLFTSTEKTTI